MAGSPFFAAAPVAGAAPPAVFPPQPPIVSSSTTSTAITLMAMKDFRNAFLFTSVPPLHQIDDLTEYFAPKIWCILNQNFI
jgi:hypothetical protein